MTLEGKRHWDFLPLFHFAAFQVAPLRQRQAHDVWRAKTYKPLWNPNCMLGHGQTSLPHWHVVVSQVCLSRDFLAQQYAPMPSSSFICSVDNKISLLKNEVDSKACSRHLKSLLRKSETLLVSQHWALAPRRPWLGHILSSFKGSCSQRSLCPQNRQLWLWGKRFPLSTHVLPHDDK